MDNLLVASVVVLLANLAVLGMSVKLYTEIMKERCMSLRGSRGPESRTEGKPGKTAAGSQEIPD